MSMTGKALVVDDEAFIRMACQAVLQLEGFETVTRADGPAALAALAAEPFDLVLIDLSMPGMDGLALLEQVANHHKQVSPIIMTGYATLEAAIRAQELGAEGFILKPFDDAGLLRTIQPVMERRLLRREYNRLQARLEAWREWEIIFNTLTDGLLVHRQDNGLITRANQTLAGWLGLASDELLDRPVGEVIEGASPCYLCRLAPPLEDALIESSTAELSGPAWAPEHAFRVRTQRLPAFTESQPETEIIHIIEDITHTKRMQTQLMQAEKLSALGRLAASLSHEINNPLQALRSGLRLLGRPTISDEKRHNYVAMLSKEVERLIDLTAQTLDFARPARTGRTASDLNQLLRETLELAKKQLLRHQIEPMLDLTVDLPPVLGIPSQLKQVFLNLILNAIDAMPDGGRLQVLTRLTGNQQFVKVIVSDNGQGMSPETVSRIFEPFFSTKDNGTGLGLSISYSIIDAHCGLIDVDSQPGQGTRFTVLLPTIAENPE
ncbi:MAG TPA: response regulator [Anaerolineae bacterium]|nr:response regulator [Anaerolineae bacterium]HMR65767.1 response regulator [Anaerolineae bacterium]